MTKKYEKTEKMTNETDNARRMPQTDELVRNMGNIKRYAAKEVGWDAAEDITQELAKIVLEILSTGKTGIHDLTAYIYGIMDNLIKSYIKGKVRWEEVKNKLMDQLEQK